MHCFTMFVTYRVMCNFSCELGMLSRGSSLRPPFKYWLPLLWWCVLKADVQIGLSRTCHSKQDTIDFHIVTGHFCET